MAEKDPQAEVDSAPRFELVHQNLAKLSIFFLKNFRDFVNIIDSSLLNA